MSSDSEGSVASYSNFPATPMVQNGDYPHRLGRASSMDAGRTRSISFVDAEDLDDLWRDVDSIGSRSSSKDDERSPRSASSPRLNATGGELGQSNEIFRGEESAGSTDGTNLRKSQPTVKIIKLDPAKCLKLTIVERPKDGSDHHRMKDRATTKNKSLPLVDWEKQTTILMRRKRFDPARGVLS